MSAWLEHVEKWKDCTLCPLHEQRDNIVLARGQVPCDVLFVGEAPGASENALGQPFKGPAGAILDDIIREAVPPDVRYAMTNLVCCFPAQAKTTENHQPTQEEVFACRPRLKEFIALCRPRLIVTVGSLATGYVHLDRFGKQPPWIPEGKCLEFVDIIHPAATMGNRMPLVQKRGAIDDAIRALRSAVEKLYEVK